MPRATEVRRHPQSDELAPRHSALKASHAISKKQQPRSCSEKSSAGSTRDPAPKSKKLLQKNEQREKRDPKHVHNAAHKQKCHQHPAAADAIGPVAQPQQQTPKCIPTEASVAHQEQKRRLALCKADVLERRPLVDARRD